MDRLVDIVLTKGPNAVGILHEALKHPYPYVFDVFTQLFCAAANMKCPQSKQKRKFSVKQTLSHVL